MDNHVCPNIGLIATLQADVKALKEKEEKDDAWKIRFEGKIDRILWAVIGLCATIILGGLGSVITYGFSKI